MFIICYIKSDKASHVSYKIQKLFLKIKEINSNNKKTPTTEVKLNLKYFILECTTCITEPT